MRKICPRCGDKMNRGKHTTCSRCRKSTTYNSKYPVIAIRIDQSLRYELESYASANGISVSEVLRKGFRLLKSQAR